MRGGKEDITRRFDAVLRCLEVEERERGWKDDFRTDEGVVAVDVDVDLGKETDLVVLSTTPVLSCC